MHPFRGRHSQARRNCISLGYLLPRVLVFLRLNVVAAGAESCSVEIRDDILMPQQLNWLVQAMLAKAPIFTLKATTIPTTQRFCSLLHKGGIESGAASISAVRWDTGRKVYRVVQDNL